MNVLAIHAKDADQTVARFLKYRFCSVYRKWAEAQESESNCLPHGTLHAAATMTAALALRTSDSLFAPLANSMLRAMQDGQAFWSTAASPIGRVVSHLAATVSFCGRSDVPLQACSVARDGLDFLVADYTDGYRSFYKDKRDGLFPKVNDKKSSEYLHALSKWFPYWGQRDSTKLCNGNKETWAVLDNNLMDAGRGDSLSVPCMLQAQRCDDTTWSYGGETIANLVRVQMRTNSNYRYVQGCWPLYLTQYLDQLIIDEKQSGVCDYHLFREAGLAGECDDFTDTLHSLLACLVEIAGAAYFDAVSKGDDPYVQKREVIDNVMTKAMRAMGDEGCGQSSEWQGEDGTVQIQNARFDGFNLKLRYKPERDSSGKTAKMVFTCVTKERVQN